jgi:hypothetical protein
MAFYYWNIRLLSLEDSPAIQEESSYKWQWVLPLIGGILRVM